MAERQLEPISDYASSLILAEKFSVHKGMLRLSIKYIFDKKIDIEQLKNAFNIEIERNDALRERFVDDKKDKACPVKSYFVEPYKLDFESADFAGMSNEAQDDAMNKIAANPIPLREAPFGRVTLIKTNDGRDGFIMTCSHYNCDSYGLFFTIKDVLAVYTSLIKGTPMPKPLASWHEAKAARHAANTPEHIAELDKGIDQHYAEYAKVSKHRNTNSFDFKRSTNEKLKKNNKKVLQPNSFKELLGMFKDKGGFDIYELNSDYTSRMKQFCAENNVTLTNFWYMVMRTYDLWHNGREETSMYHYNMNNRPTRALKNTGGCTVNSNYIRVDVKNNATIAEAFEAIEKEFNFAYRHGDRQYDNEFSRKISGKYGISEFSESGATMVTIMPLDFELDEDIRGEVEYLDYGYTVLPLYHLLFPGARGNMKLYFIYQLQHYDREQTNFMQLGYKAAVNAIIKLGMNATLNELYDELGKMIG